MLDKKPLHVAMLIWSYWPGHEGGAERQCRKLIPALVNRGIDVTIWTAWTSRSHARRETSDGAVIVRLGRFVPRLWLLRGFLERWSSSRFPGGAAMTRRRARLREALSFWLNLPMVYFARLTFLRELNQWLEQAENRPDIIHVHESSWLAGAAATLGKRYRIPVVAKTAVNPALPSLGYDTPRRRTYVASRRDCFFLALTPQLADNLRSAGIASAQIAELPNGVEIPTGFSPQPLSKKVLFVANFSQSVEEKAFDILLAAWSILAPIEPDARLLLLGSGDRAPWEALTKAMGLEGSATFLGWVPDPSAYYQQADIFVLPSRSEGMSNALLEAQAYGLACVVSDIPGNRAIVEDGVNGLVVPVGDAQALAEAILKLLHDSRLREDLGHSARKVAKERYSLSTVAGSLTEIYIKLTTNKPVGQTT
jgi:glycosyltransferase involved in cell wall biosynthesis